MAGRWQRTPNEAGAREVAGALYDDVKDVEWIPSDDADVFRVTFTSGRRARVLKLAISGNPAVWREVGAFPAIRSLGVREVLEFEHTTEDLPGLGYEFHVTAELTPPSLADQAMARMWADDRPRAVELAHWFGDCTRRVESLDRRRVPRANSPERTIELATRWWRPHYDKLVTRPDCPQWVREFVDQVWEHIRRPPTSFGGWGGELLRAPDGTFLLIDWPSLGAAPPCSQAATALEVLLRFGAADPAPLVEAFMDGWAPGGLDDLRLQDLRLSWVHSILGWAGMSLTFDDPDADLGPAYAAAQHDLGEDDPTAWLRRAAGNP
ncbi:hypothetical protein [Actinopolymorpha rutila]|uniref:Phosphotransferase enzyme family protein n=1 Tax=Actinopolymorpha rutila TaxID=446787 RepID=A0A852ZFP0_9ACTN|nr:hypothetical protein [Actinopolymorpha rutila]NYH91991.1 hypothetical protein [Actinopolymorpha rutila]